MDLNNIVLPGLSFNQLFNGCVIHSTDKVSIKQNSNSLIQFLGQNDKKVTLLVEYSDFEYINEKDLRFLTGILLACKLKISDVAIVNLYKTPAINLQTIISELSPNVIMLFNILPSRLEIFKEISLLEMNNIEDIIYLKAPLLSDLETNSILKKQLWSQLKRIFSI